MFDDYERGSQKLVDSCFGAIIFGTIALIVWLIKTVIGLLIGLFVKTGEKNPEDELRNFKSMVYQRQQIYGIACPKCGTKNEDHQQHCYMCGSAMVAQVEKTSSSNNTIQIAAGVAVILVVAVIVFSSKWEFRQTANVQASNQNSQAAVNLPTSTPTNGPEEVVRGYLNAVANSECAKAMEYFLMNSNISREKCDSEYFQVHELLGVVSGGQKSDSSFILVYARGKFQLEKDIYGRLKFEIFAGKINRFPETIGPPIN